MHTFEIWLARLERVLEAVAGLALVIMMVLVSADGGGRYLFDNPLPSVYEVVELYLMIALVFLAWPGLQAARAQPSVELLFRHFPVAVKRWLDALFLALALVVVAVMTWKAIEQAWTAFELNRVINGMIFDMPTGPSWLFAAAGLLVLGIRLLVQLLRALAGKAPPERHEIAH